MKIVRLKVKAPEVKAKEVLGSEVYYHGKCLTHVAIEDRWGRVFDVFNVLYNRKIYFLVRVGSVIKECLALNCIPLFMEVTEQLRDELFDYCEERIIDEL